MNALGHRCQSNDENKKQLLPKTVKKLYATKDESKMQRFQFKKDRFN